MSVFIDQKYVSLLSPKLEQFKQKSQNLWNFRCPVCNDSQKNKLKARGYVYRKKSNLFYMCHNCGSSMSLGNLVKYVDPALYDEYKLERFKNESHSNVAKPDFSQFMSKPVFDKSKKIELPTIESLAKNHPAKTFLNGRKIPHSWYAELYYTDDFQSFVNEIHPENDKNLPENDARIVIPFYDKDNNLIGFQGRAIQKTDIRYITIKLSEESQKVFGLNKIDFSKKIYVVEGPFDSMFLDNSIAMMDATLTKAKVIVGDYDYVFVYDNEPRNKQIVKHIDNTIKMGYNVCLWPKDIEQKDINDMILAGLHPQSIIDSNTHSDLRAKLEFEQWRKV